MKTGKWDMRSQYGKGIILEILNESPGLSVSEVESKLGSKSKLIGRNMRSLYEDGFLERDYRVSWQTNRLSFVYFLAPDGKIQLDHLTR